MRDLKKLLVFYENNIHLFNKIKNLTIDLIFYEDIFLHHNTFVNNKYIANKPIMIVDSDDLR